MHIERGQSHPIIPDLRQALRATEYISEDIFDESLDISLRDFASKRGIVYTGAIEQPLIDALRQETFAYLAENFLALPVEDLLQPAAAKKPDYSKPGSFGTFESADWAKFIINGLDLGWYVRRKPLTKDDCGKEFFISVCAGDDVPGCAGLNYAQWCDKAKAEATAFAMTLCPPDCPNPIITDHAAKWDCGANPASRTGFRAFCHHQIKLVCFTT